MENLLFLGVPILKHIRVLKVQCSFSQHLVTKRTANVETDVMLKVAALSVTSYRGAKNDFFLHIFRRCVRYVCN